MKRRSPVQIAVIGAGAAGEEGLALAAEVGAELARRGAVVVCGGRGGIMEAVARGASQAGGLSVGILPSYDWREANPHLSIVLPTGLGQARNAVVVAAAHAVIAFAGEGGTMSEVGLALKLGRPVIGLRAWGHVHGVVAVDDPITAVEAALACAASSAG